MTSVIAETRAEVSHAVRSAPVDGRMNNGTSQPRPCPYRRRIQPENPSAGHDACFILFIWTQYMRTWNSNCSSIVRMISFC